jgi:hypothetical protein
VTSLSEKLHRLASGAKGRCHSCAHQYSYDLPTGTRYWCRAFHKEMTVSERDRVRDCDRWSALKQDVREGIRDKALDNPLVRPHLDQEDRVFWRLKCYLDFAGIDLQTVLILTGKKPADRDSFAWVRSLDDRFSDDDPGPLSEVFQELDSLGYSNIRQLVEGVLRPK